ncbi:hypothetical protein ACQ4PT_066763 [Festuca glaucescens]
MAPSCCFFWAWWLPLMMAIVVAEEQEEGCSAKSCGNLTISYPFWLLYTETGRPCGPLDFEAACLNNTPLIRSSAPVADGLAIIDIAYEEQSLRVVDQGKLIYLQDCQVFNMNTSVKMGHSFRIDDENLNLIFYNCTRVAAEAARRDRALVEMRCGNESNVFVRGGVLYDATGAYARLRHRGLRRYRHAGAGHVRRGQRQRLRASHKRRLPLDMAAAWQW